MWQNSFRKLSKNPIIISFNWRRRNNRTSAVAVGVKPAAAVGHLLQLGIDDLLGLLEHGDEVGGLVGVAGREEGVGRAGPLGAARAADAVDVVLRIGRIVEIDYEFHVFHIWNYYGLDE